MKHTGIILTLCILLAGCTVPESFDNAPVDRNAKFYLNCEPAAIAKAWNEYCDSLLPVASAVHGVAGSNAVKKLLLIKLLIRNLGINEISALKMSSAVDKNGMFSNSAAIKITPDVSGGISFFGKNQDVAAQIGNLPYDCSDVIAVSLDFNKLWKTFENSKLKIRRLAADHIKVILGTTPEKAAERHSGVWIISMRQPRSKEMFALSIPDAGKHLYNRWKTLFSPDKDVFKLKLSADTEFFIAHRNGRTELYSTDKELNVYHSASKTLAENSCFQDTMAKNCRDCVYLSWSDRGEGHNRIFGEFKTAGKELVYPEFFILKRTQYGFYGYGTDDNNLSVSLLREHLLMLLSILPEFPSDNVKNNADRTKDAIKKNEENESAACFANLQKLSKHLQDYADSNNGSMPDGLHIDGLNKLINKTNLNTSILCCPGSGCELSSTKNLDRENTGYIYFGNWKNNSSDKLPVLMDMPENHNGFFYVILRDGSVQKLVLKQQMSIKRMASYLHTVFKYSEDEFSELIRRANEVDEFLDKESKQ